MSDVWNSFIVYTIETGGDYRVQRADRAEFDKAVAERRVYTNEGWSESPESTYVVPYYIAFVETADDFDFVLGRQREVVAR